jgi:hypothetical protein
MRLEDIAMIGGHCLTRPDAWGGLGDGPGMKGTSCGFWAAGSWSPIPDLSHATGLNAAYYPRSGLLWIRGPVR